MFHNEPGEAVGGGVDLKKTVPVQPPRKVCIANRNIRQILKCISVILAFLFRPSSPYPPLGSICHLYFASEFPAFDHPRSQGLS